MLLLFAYLAALSKVPLHGLSHRPIRTWLIPALHRAFTLSMPVPHGLLPHPLILLFICMILYHTGPVFIRKRGYYIP